MNPIRVAIYNDFDIVVAGLTHLLAAHPGRLTVVETEIGDPASLRQVDADVVLFDSFGNPARLQALGQLVADCPAQVMLFTADAAEQVEAAVAVGAAGVLDKSVSAVDLVAALERLHHGQPVVPATAGLAGETESAAAVAADSPQTVVERWPGQAAGLTERESEVLALICQGLANTDIAAELYLSMNTIKTYIRGLYRQIEVDSRTQAVLWGVEHGLGKRSEGDARSS